MPHEHSGTADSILLFLERWRGRVGATVAARVRAVILTTRDTAVDQAFLWGELDGACIRGLRDAACDCIGARGELHTAVTKSASLISAPWVVIGAVTEHDGCHFLAVRLERA